MESAILQVAEMLRKIKYFKHLGVIIWCNGKMGEQINESINDGIINKM